jgi:primary-amine oxidase
VSLAEERSLSLTVETAHPLDSLSRDEISLAAEIIRGEFGFGEDLRFETLDLDEPPKEVVRVHGRGDRIERRAAFSVYRRAQTGVWRGRVDLHANTILSVEHLPDARPMISPEEFFWIEEAVKKDERFKQAMLRRGIEDMDLVCVDPWSAGNFDVPGEEGRRLAHTFAWVRNAPLDNYYAHPVEGINAVVDVDRQEVLRIDDHFADDADIIPVPRTPANYDSALLTEFRAAAAALDVVQPGGPGFIVEGNKITWESWDLRVGFTAREGLVLHTVGYTAGGRRRPVLYRASLSEMAVPYGSPERGHPRKNVFDIGEYGLGKLANELALGCDCLGVIHYFDVHLADITGQPRTLKNAICLHEEDYGLSWKHWDFRTDRTEVRRARRLVVSSISTVGNYEYASYWYLYQDGTIEFEMKATGIINTAACRPGKPSKYGSEVAPGVVGQIHQHAFCARLDLEIDGPANTVVECDTVAPPMGPENPHGNVFYIEEKPLRRELEARRNYDFSTMRFWKIVNPTVSNRVGGPTGYRLEAKSMLTPFTRPEGPSGRRAGFMYHHLWVTPYRPDERYPAGEFVNHSTGDDGLPAWTVRDRAVENEDIVVWHSFGLHHLPRPEDYPVQPCATCGFKLVPSGFFDGNPAIDLPPAVNAASCCA